MAYRHKELRTNQHRLRPQQRLPHLLLHELDLYRILREEYVKRLLSIRRLLPRLLQWRQKCYQTRHHLMM